MQARKSSGRYPWGAGWKRTRCAFALFVAMASTAAACGGDDGGAAGTAAGVTAATGAAAAGGTPAAGGTGAAATGGVGTGGTGVTGMPTGGTGGGTNAGGGGVVPADGGMAVGDAGAPVEEPCTFADGAVPAGACDNPADCAVVESGAVDMESDRCGRMCILNGADCTVKCMTDAIDVSAECARCYADIVQCSAVNCALMCFADSEGMPCRVCVDTMCGPAFNTCSGRM